MCVCSLFSRWGLVNVCVFSFLSVGSCVCVFSFLSVGSSECVCVLFSLGGVV